MSVTELNILESISRVSGKNDKRKILKDNNKNKRLFELLDATLNYKRKFYIKKWEEPGSAGGAVVRITKDLHDDFMQLLADLESQVYRGDIAKGMVESFLASCNQQQRQWYSRVLRRDLKAGFGIDSAVDCGFKIPIFDVQLAKDGHDCKKLSQMLLDGLLASRKFDGYRCLAVVEDGEATLYTRNGEVFQNFPDVEKSLVEMANGDNMVFDGEIMSDDFNSTQRSAFASKRKTVVGDMVYHIFDMIPYDEWVSEKFVTRAFKRYQDLNAFVGAALNAAPHIKNIKTVERFTVKTLQEILDLEIQFIAEGFEGVMTNTDIPYYKGKSSNKMLKFKTFKSMDCEVIGFYPGKPDTKYKDSLGGLIVRQENGVECEVGSGFSDEERDEIWNDQKSVLGRIAEIEYQELTSGDQRMRFPIKKRWRPDKDKK